MCNIYSTSILKKIGNKSISAGTNTLFFFEIRSSLINFLNKHGIVERTHLFVDTEALYLWFAAHYEYCPFCPLTNFVGALGSAVYGKSLASVIERYNLLLTEVVLTDICIENNSMLKISHHLLLFKLSTRTTFKSF